jgi:hypothetical protein
MAVDPAAPDRASRPPGLKWKRISLGEPTSMRERRCR